MLVEIRDIHRHIVDRKKFRKFRKTCHRRYNEALFVPATIGDGIYAMPETMNFWVLFYRSDVFEVE